jgi:hypothetical protein
MLNRHAEELRTLDADEAEIEALERFIIVFSERYLNAAIESGSAPVKDPEAPAHSDPKEHAGAPRLQVHQQVSPNFGSPVRRWLRG